jgi:hypothetical protein
MLTLLRIIGIAIIASILRETSSLSGASFHPTALTQSVEASNGGGAGSTVNGGQCSQSEDDDDAGSKISDNSSASQDGASQADSQSDSNPACVTSNDIADDDDSAAETEPRPTLNKGFDYTTDSEKNSEWSYQAFQTLPLQEFYLVYRKDAVYARDALGSQELAATSLSVHHDFSDQFGLSGGLGVAHALFWSDPIGSIESDLDLFDTSIVARTSRDMLAVTAQEIRQNIRQTDFSLSFSKDLNEQLSADVELHETLYSDGNQSKDIELSPQYTFQLLTTKLILNYQFQYSAFADNPDNGYWAPKELVAQSGSLKWVYDWSSFFSSVQLSAGDQIVAQFPKTSLRSDGGAFAGYGGGSGFAASFGGTLGIRVNGSSSIQTYVSHDLSSGYRSSAAGIFMSCAF